VLISFSEPPTPTILCSKLLFLPTALALLWLDLFPATFEVSPTADDIERQE